MCGNEARHTLRLSWRKLLVVERKAPKEAGRYRRPPVPDDDDPTTDEDVNGEDGMAERYGTEPADADPDFGEEEDDFDDSAFNEDDF